MSLLEGGDLEELRDDHARFPRTFLETGSFLDMFDDHRCCSTFDGLQLKREYHQLAKTSLENFIDKWYPGPKFYKADKGQIKKITRKWLDHGGGLRFWGPGQECDYVDEEDEVKKEAMEWHKDDGNKKIEQDVRALVKHQATRVAEFVLRRARILKKQNQKRKRTGGNEDEGEEEQQMTKRFRIAPETTPPLPNRPASDMRQDDEARHADYNREGTAKRQRAILPVRSRAAGLSYQ